MNDADFGKRAASLKQIVRGGRVSDFPDELKILLSLAEHNASHFSLRAAQAYLKNHRQALLLAPQQDRLWQALHYEALALHSFTDDFASGHTLESREMNNQLVAWTRNVRSPTKRILMARIGTAFTGGLVNFYHNAYNWKGGMMENIAGGLLVWIGDKRYRIVDPSCVEKSKIGRRNCSDFTTVGNARPSFELPPRVSLRCCGSRPENRSPQDRNTPQCVNLRRDTRTLTHL